MGLLSRLFGGRKGHDAGPLAASPAEGESLFAQDTRAAIEGLSQVVKDNPGAVEIYLALGSLYRSQGEIERAIQIRNSLIVRHGLDERLKAMAWFELGRDFRRGGFLDRAAHAFDQARGLMGDKPAIMHEMAMLALDSGEFERAAELFRALGLQRGQAHCLVRRAQELVGEGNTAATNKFLRQAVRIFPGCVEGWRLQAVLACQGKDLSQLRTALEGGLKHVEPKLRFILLEGVIDALQALDREGEHGDAAQKLALEAVSDIAAASPDVLLHYYGARLLLFCGQKVEARTWLEKALLQRPDFWLARLEVFHLTKDEQTFTPFFREQIEFFMGRTRGLRRFVCGNCGLKRDTIFIVCPRCRSWHSIMFRFDFSQ